jgi:hypothetical protein
LLISAERIGHELQIESMLPYLAIINSSRNQVLD